MRPSKTVLILGGGVGGLVAANRLRRLLPREHRVILVEREAFHLFQPSLLWLAVGDRRIERIRRPLERLRGRGIEVVTASVTGIDPAARAVTADGRRIVADALVVALGADLAPELVPGLGEAGHNLYSAGGAERFREALAAFRGGRLAVLTAAPAYKCPAAPYEAVMLIDAALRRRGVRDHTELTLYAAEPAPMPVTGPAIGAAVRQLIESKGVRYHPEHQVSRVDAATRRLTFANGVTADFDLLLYVPPHRAPEMIRASGMSGAAGWVEVDRRTFETRWPGVYAIGDVTTVPLAMGKPLPKAGVFAEAQAEVVAANIARAWTGRGGQRTFDGWGECFLEAGGGRSGHGAGNFYAEPAPAVRLRAPARWWHWIKVLHEQYWLRRWF